MCLFVTFLKLIVIIIGVAFAAATIGLFLGYLCGMLNFPVFDLYVLFVNSIPVYIFVLIFSYVVPQVVGISVPSFFLGAAALGFYSVASFYPVLKNGAKTTHMVSVFVEQFSVLIKKTYVLSTIGIVPLTNMISGMSAKVGAPLKCYVMIAGVYFLIVSFVKICSKRLYKYIYRGSN